MLLHEVGLDFSQAPIDSGPLDLAIPLASQLYTVSDASIRTLG